MGKSGVIIWRRATRIGALSGTIGVRERRRQSEILRRVFLPEGRGGSCNGVIEQ
jgi:hypothetical protein